MNRLFHKFHRLALTLGVFGALSGTGCDGDKSSVGSPSAPAPLAAESTGPFFEGVIKAKEQRDLLLNGSEITYTIAKGKIRREAIPIAPLGKLVELGKAKAGIICDVSNGSVVLYRSGLAGKFFVRMPLAEYRALAAGSIIGLPDVALDLPGTRPLLWRHIGTFFAYLPRPLPDALATNQPDARTVGGRTCDVLTIRHGETTYEVCHCTRLAFDRPLLELVELGFPAEVTGFPCQMRRLRTVSPPPPDGSQSKAAQILRKGAEIAAQAAEKAMKYETELIGITEGTPDDSAFTLEGEYVELGSWDEFRLRFDPQHGGNHGLDWD